MFEVEREVCVFGLIACTQAMHASKKMSFVGKVHNRPLHEVNHSETYKKRYRISLIAAVILALIGLVVAGWGITRFSKDAAGLSGLGDFLAGTVGPLWSVAGLLIVFVAFLAQRQQLEMQKEMIINTAKEVALQRLSSTFFELLRSHHTIVSNMVIYRHGPLLGNALSGMTHSTRFETRGRECLSAFLSELGADIRGQLKKYGSDESSFQMLESTYSGFYKSNEASLAVYFGNLYSLLHVIRLIHPDERSIYTSIVQACLSGTELALLFYHSYLAPQETVNSMPLRRVADELRFFERADLSRLLSPNDRNTILMHHHVEAEA